MKVREKKKKDPRETMRLDRREADGQIRTQRVSSTERQREIRGQELTEAGCQEEGDRVTGLWHQGRAVGTTGRK